MGRSIATATAVSTLFGLWVTLGAHQAQAAPTNECLSAPKGVSPKGQHWYYHLDRATQRKCWYLRSSDLARETTEDLTVDKRKAQVIDSPKSSAPEPSISDDANRAAMSASLAAQTSSDAVPTPQMTDLPSPADLSGPAAGAENKQPSTAESPETPNDQDQFGSLQGAGGSREAPQGPAPDLRDVDATVASGTTQPQIAASSAATENTEIARHDTPSAEPAVSSTTSQGSVAGSTTVVAGTTTVVVIAAASVLAALAGFVLLVQRRRRHAMQDVLLPDQATSAPKRVATADVLSARTRELLLRCLEEPASPAKRERAL